MELLQNTATTLRFPEAGADAVTFDAAPKVTVTRDSDGSTVVEAKVATEAKEGEAVYWTVDLTAAQLSEVDLLTAVWSGEVGGAAVSYTTHAEVVGNFVTSLAAIEAKYDGELGETELIAKREAALHSVETACGVAFRARYAKELLGGSGDRSLLLSRPRLLRVLSVEVEGEALTEEELGELILDPAGLLVLTKGWVWSSWLWGAGWRAAWPEGTGNVEVAYVHGYESLLAAVLPVRDLAAYLLTASATDLEDRATTMTTEAGTYSLVTPGVRGATFPLPSVNSFVTEHGFH